MPTGVYDNSKRKGMFVKGNKSALGYRHTKEALKEMSVHQKGRKLSVETRQKMSFIHKERVKKGLNNLWKGGVNPINIGIRKSIEMKLWRESVFQRDNWTCMWCGKRGGRLVADHIQLFSLFPELRFAIDNGRTLCRECHIKRHTKYTD